MANNSYIIKELERGYKVFLPPEGYNDMPGVLERRTRQIRENDEYLKDFPPTAPEKPITGSFIYAHPPNYCGAEALFWNTADWKRELTRLKSYGLDTLVFQASLWNELQECYYPSELFKSYRTWNVVEPMLEAANDLGFTVYLGGYGSVTCWRERLSSQMISDEVERQVGCFKELLRYRDAFHGFYFSPESAYSGKRDLTMENFLGELYHRFFSEIRNADDRLKILMSPATFYYANGMEEMKNSWCQVFASDHPDIIAPQDSIGCGCITLKHQVEAIKIWHEICEDRHIEHWSNVESFDSCEPYDDEHSRCAAQPERIIAQINHAAPYVTKLISWELLYYTNPELHPAGIPMTKALFEK